ncbi:MAG: hypothetical protein OXG85_06240 [Chloroflexi bacterium]|nr:hypothetical protein [Chloroflexota bacterium]
MMIRLYRTLAVLIVALLALGIASAEGDEESVPYVQASGFNAPVLEGWADLSTDEIAQFHLAEAEATIRTALAAGADPPAAARSHLADWLGSEIGEPAYSDKVNLADGTWHSLVFDIDAATTASVMARQDDANVVLISFVETSPDARTIMLTLAQADDALDNATPEIGLALDRMAGLELDQLDEAGIVDLPSGEWQVYERDGLSAMGMVFGNDSYVALQDGAPADLARLADAWNRTLLGFFITPDNSLYLALGLIATFGILGLLILSYFWRSRSIQRDLAMLNALAAEED